MTSWFGLLEWPAKRFYKFVLRRILGDFLAHDLDVDQLDVQLAAGVLELKNVQLNVALVNNHLAHLPLKLQNGFLASVKASIPWRHLLKEPCRLHLCGVHLQFVPNATPPDSETNETNAPNPAKTTTKEAEAEKQKEKEEEEKDDGFLLLSKFVEQVVSQIELVIDNARFSIVTNSGSLVAFLPSLQLLDAASPAVASAPQQQPLLRYQKMVRFHGFRIESKDIESKDVKSGMESKGIESKDNEESGGGEEKDESETKEREREEEATIMHGDIAQDCVIELKLNLNPLETMLPAVDCVCMIESLHALVDPNQLSRLLHVWAAVRDAGDQMARQLKAMARKKRKAEEKQKPPLSVAQMDSLYTSALFDSRPRPSSLLLSTSEDLPFRPCTGADGESFEDDERTGNKKEEKKDEEDEEEKEEKEARREGTENVLLWRIRLEVGHCAVVLLEKPVSSKTKFMNWWLRPDVPKTRTTAGIMPAFARIENIGADHLLILAKTVCVKISQTSNGSMAESSIVKLGITEQLLSSSSSLPLFQCEEKESSNSKGRFFDFECLVQNDEHHALCDLYFRPCKCFLDLAFYARAALLFESMLSLPPLTSSSSALEDSGVLTLTPSSLTVFTPRCHVLLDLLSGIEVDLCDLKVSSVPALVTTMTPDDDMWKLEFSHVTASLGLKPILTIQSFESHLPSLYFACRQNSPFRPCRAANEHHHPTSPSATSYFSALADFRWWSLPDAFEIASSFETECGYNAGTFLQCCFPSVILSLSPPQIIALSALFLAAKEEEEEEEEEKAEKEAKEAKEEKNEDDVLFYSMIEARSGINSTMTSFLHNVALRLVVLSAKVILHDDDDETTEKKSDKKERQHSVVLDAFDICLACVIGYDRKEMHYIRVQMSDVEVFVDETCVLATLFSPNGAPMVFMEPVEQDSERLLVRNPVIVVTLVVKEPHEPIQVVVSVRGLVIPYDPCLLQLGSQLISFYEDLLLLMPPPTQKTDHTPAPLLWVRATQCAIEFLPQCVALFDDIAASIDHNGNKITARLVQPKLFLGCLLSTPLPRLCKINGFTSFEKFLLAGGFVCVFALDLLQVTILLSPTLQVAISIKNAVVQTCTDSFESLVAVINSFGGMTAPTPAVPEVTISLLDVVDVLHAVEEGMYSSGAPRKGQEQQPKKEEQKTEKKEEQEEEEEEEGSSHWISPPICLENYSCEEKEKEKATFSLGCVRFCWKMVAGRDWNKGAKEAKGGRDLHNLVECILTEVAVDVHVNDKKELMQARVEVMDIEVNDGVASSLYRKLFFYDMEYARAAQMPMLKLHMSNVVKKEWRISVRLLPLRLFIDQDAVEFLIRFFAPCFLATTEKKSHKNESKNDGASVARPHHPGSISEPEQMFIQSFECNAFSVRVDYSPKRLDYRSLFGSRNYIELVHLLPLEGARFQFKEVKLKGYTVARLGAELGKTWGMDIGKRQAHRYLAAVQPIRSMVNIGAGVLDLFIIPIDKYSRLGMVRGVYAGTTSFVRSVTGEIMWNTAKFAQRTKSALHTVRRTLKPSSTTNTKKKKKKEETESKTEEGEEDKLQTEDAEEQPLVVWTPMPGSCSEGLWQGLNSVARGLQVAAHSMVVVPRADYEKYGTGKAIKSFVTAVPAALLAPMIGFSEAVSQASLGLHNTVDPQRKNLRDLVYKRNKPKK